MGSQVLENFHIEGQGNLRKLICLRCGVSLAEEDAFWGAANAHSCGNDGEQRQTARRMKEIAIRQREESQEMMASAQKMVKTSQLMWRKLRK